MLTNFTSFAKKSDFKVQQLHSVKKSTKCAESDDSDINSYNLGTPLSCLSEIKTEKLI